MFFFFSFLDLDSNFGAPWVQITTEPYIAPLLYSKQVPGRELVQYINFFFVDPIDVFDASDESTEYLRTKASVQ